MLIKSFSEHGFHHAEMNQDNQDAVYYGNNKNFTVISLADGVSECLQSRTGAEIASRASTNLLLKHGDLFMELDNQKIAQIVISHVLYELRYIADQESKKIEDYSSTLACVLLDKRRNKILCMNLGDAIILASDPGNCKVLTMPYDSSEGCCVTTTYNAYLATVVNFFDTSSIDSVVICSDGAWKQMFQKNKLKYEVFALIAASKYDVLEQFLRRQKCFDDFSFISLDMKQSRKGKAA